MVDGDAPVASANMPASAAPARTGHPPARMAKAVTSKGPARDRQHMVENGQYVANRSGTKLCAGFQNGSCMDVDRANRCSRSTHYVHQRAKCLAPDHGADKCTKSGSPPAFNTKGSGKPRRAEASRVT